MEDNQDSLVISESEFDAAVSPPDCKGRINLRVEQMLQKELEDIAEDSNYPLDSVSQVVRYCCMVGLERLRQWKPRPTMLGALKAANSLIARDRIQSESMDLVQRMDERVRWYIQRREFDEAITLVATVRAQFESVADTFWKRHIIKEIDTKFQQWYQDIEEAQK